MRTPLLLALCLGCSPEQEDGGGPDDPWLRLGVEADCYAVVTQDNGDDGSVEEIEVRAFDPDTGELLEVTHYDGTTLDAPESWKVWYVLGPRGWLEEYTTRKGSPDPKFVRILTRDTEGRITSEQSFNPQNTEQEPETIFFEFDGDGQLRRREGDWWIEHYDYRSGRREMKSVDLYKDGEIDSWSIYSYPAPPPNQDATIRGYDNEYYGYDPAPQVSYETRDARGRLLYSAWDEQGDGILEHQSTWTYDVGGQLVYSDSDQGGGDQSQHSYLRDADGRVLEHTYQQWQSGKRTRLIQYTWHWSRKEVCARVPTFIDPGEPVSFYIDWGT